MLLSTSSLKFRQLEIDGANGEKVGGKGLELLGGFHQPLQDGVGVNLKHPSRSTDAQAFGQTCQDAHDELDRGLFAVEERAMRLQKGALARRTVELTPRATTGMAVGPEIAQAEPAPIVTIVVRTKVPGGVDFTRTPVRRRHRGGRYRRRRLGRRGLSLTQGTMGLVRQAVKGFRLVGSCALGLDGRRCRWARGLSARLGNRQHDEEPHEG
jgi:hypothetical protein